jgi:hypothetical protein
MPIMSIYVSTLTRYSRLEPNLFEIPVAPIRIEAQ